MNTDWHDLIQRHIAGLTTEEEATLLQDTLKRDDAVARLYLRYMNLDVALEAHASSRGAVNELLVSVDANVATRSARWLSWRPLTAAAAGILFGMFCTSVVFGFVVQRGVEKRTPLALFEPGFENAQMPLAIGFPGGAGRWSGDAAQVVTAEHGVSAKEGKLMLRLEASPRGAPRFTYQVVDLTSMPASGNAETREIEISASFAAAEADASVRYVIRAFGVTEAPDKLDAAWLDRRDESIASAARGFDVRPGMTGWQTFSVKIQVPRSARSLVLLFGVRTPDKTSPASAHYLDDVQVSLIESQPLP